jgi:uncharacterized protein involved in exopolysaccharide biosynthesis/Mrp family chromosome partitioning ATPase
MDAVSTNGTQGSALRETLGRRWRAVLLGALLGLVLAVGYLFLVPLQYQSTASVLVTATTGADAATPTNGQGNRDTVNLDTEAQLVTSTDTINQARKLLGGAASPQQLEQHVSATIPPNTSILQISFTASSAPEAQRGARAFAQAYLTVRGQVAQNSLDSQVAGVTAQIKDVRTQLQTASGRVRSAAAGSVDRSIAQAEADVLTSQLSTLTAQLNQLESLSVSPGRVIVQADLPSSPSGAGLPVVLAAGLVLGLVLGTAFALMRDRADRRVRTAADAARVTGVPVVSLLEDKQADTRAPSRSFRRLSNTLTSLLPSGRRAVVVTSAGSETPSAVVAVQLATALAAGGHSVTLVSADRGAEGLLGAAVARRDGAGLGEVLAGRRALEEVLHPVATTPGLRWLPVGEDTGDLSARLQGAAVGRLVATLSDLSEFVVLHAAPAGANTDAQSLARVANAGLVVVEAGRTEADELADAVVQLDQVNLADVSCVLAAPRLLRTAAPVAGGRQATPAPQERAPQEKADTGAVPLAGTAR